MILLEELVKRGLIREDQVPEIVKTAEDKYEGNIDQALLSYSVNEDAILELKSKLGRKEQEIFVLETQLQRCQKALRSALAFGVSDSPRLVGPHSPRQQSRIQKLQAIIRGFIARRRFARSKIALESGILAAMKNTVQGECTSMSVLLCSSILLAQLFSHSCFLSLQVKLAGIFRPVGQYSTLSLQR